MRESQRRKIEAGVAPHLETDEQIQAAFIGQTPIPPVTYALIVPILLIPISRSRTIVVTARNLYVFSNKWMRFHAYTGDPYKVPIEEARLESGTSWLRVDRGPKLWVLPFGPGKRSLRTLARTAFASRASQLRAGIAPRDRGLGSTPM